MTDSGTTEKLLTAEAFLTPTLQSIATTVRIAIIFLIVGMRSIVWGVSDFITKNIAF